MTPSFVLHTGPQALARALEGLDRRRVRAPHHTTSAASMRGVFTMGADANARFVPGELSLAHLGTLVLEDLPEFTEEALRVIGHAFRWQRVSLTSRGYQLDTPAVFDVRATATACPCGDERCSCTPEMRQRWQKRTGRAVMLVQGEKVAL